MKFFPLRDREGNMEYALTESGDILSCTSALQLDADMEAPFGVIAYDPFRRTYFGRFYGMTSIRQFENAEPKNEPIDRLNPIKSTREGDRIWKAYLTAFKAAVKLAKEKYGEEFPVIDD